MEKQQITIIDYLSEIHPKIKEIIGNRNAKDFWVSMMDENNHIACGVVLRFSW